jgi:hypothetical protein
VVSLRGDQTLAEVRRWMADHGPGSTHHGFPVMDPELGLVGLVSRRDLSDPSAPATKRVRDVIRGPFAVAFEDTTLQQASDLMAREGLGRLPVVKREDPRKVVAVLSGSDVRSGIRQHLKEADQAERTIYRRWVFSGNCKATMAAKWSVTWRTTVSCAINRHARNNPSTIATRSSGTSCAIALAGAVRRWLHIEDLVTIWHLDNLSKVVLLKSLIITYSNATETFMVWYAQDPIEMMTFHQRFFGSQDYLFGGMVLCSCLIPLLLFSPSIRTNTI